MYVYWKYSLLLSGTVILSLVSQMQPMHHFLSAKVLAQSLPSPDMVVPDRALLQNENLSNPNELPWLLVSQNRHQPVPIPITAKISTLLTSNDLNPISCSKNSVVILSINNLYIACASPTDNYPPGNYNVTIPDL